MKSALWIKICGITRSEDAHYCATLGVDAIGLNFYAPSPRSVTVESARTIISALPEEMEKIGVFVNHAREEVVAIAQSLSLTGLQFHGDEPDELVLGWPEYRVLRAVRPRAVPEVLSAFARYPEAMILLDAFSADAYGGTGKTLDPTFVDAALATDASRTILSGGLTPDSLAALLTRHEPYGIDVASGVELAPGIKCAKKLQRFVQNAHQAVTKRTRST